MLSLMDQIEIQKIRSNIPKLYVYAFFQCFLVIIPVIIPFFESKGLTIREVFLLQSIFGVALIVFDVPAGYLADFFGRKNTMIVGSIVTAIGYQTLSFGHTFMHFAVFELIVGLGMSLQSGCDIALLYGSLDKLDLAGRKAKFLGRRITAQTVGEGFASLMGGFLAGFSLSWPAHANSVSAWVPVFISMTIVEPPGDKLPRNSHFQNFKSIGMALFGHSRLLTMVIFSFIFYGFATYCAVWSLQPYWKARGLDVSTFGYLWAANSFMVAIVARYAHNIEEGLGSVKTVLIIGVLPVIGYLGMGLTGGAMGLLFTLAFPICRGLNQVIFQDAINNRVPAEVRATTNSVASLGMRALFAVFGPFIGHLLDTKGPDQTLVYLGVVYLIGFFIIVVPLLTQRHLFKTS